MTKKLVLLLTLISATVSVGVSGAAPLPPGSSGVPEISSAPWRDYKPEWNSTKTIISQYDPVIREVAQSGGFDWRLISAIAMQESRFDHDVVSRSGAVGLMQVMPSTARGFKVAREQMTDPFTNVRMGVGLLGQISSTLKFPRAISERDRLSITLAAYNCGIGRVLDARRLAVKYGENHNSWSVVAKYLKLLSDPTYYEDPVVRVGHFGDNAQTLGFVRNVLRYYDSYCELAAL
jgi:membrane-bound lytic murein transglycosylase F